MSSTTKTDKEFTVNTPENLDKKAVRFPQIAIRDNGKVRIGGQGPLFRPSSITDTGKVRLGGQGPIFR